MVFLIGGANSASGDYEINNSGLFNGSNQYINKTYSSEESVLTKWTVSAWVKRGNLSNGSDHQYFFQAGDYSIIGFRDDDTLMVQVWNSDGGGKAVLTNAKYRDVGAWYHIVSKYDSTQGTASNRLKLYVNGEEVTSFGTDQRSSISQNDDDLVGDDVAHTIGYGSNNTSYFDGYMADVHVICGNCYDASSFGETNDNGVWVPKKFTGNYGSNGSFHEFGAESTGVGAGRFASDTSGNGNHYDTNNFSSQYQMTDSPTNNFATLNPTNKLGSCLVSKGATEYDSNSSSGSSIVSTIAPSKGKWYVEVKAVTSTIHIGVSEVGLEAFNVKGQGASRPNINYQYGDGSNPNVEIDGTHVDTEAAFTTNDIIGLALDLDDGELIIYKNGTAINSGTAYNLHTNTTHGNTGFSVQTATGSGNTRASFNFGSPTFSISSGNADANGYGEFEYAVPSGYYALCTKNLAKYG